MYELVVESLDNPWVVAIVLSVLLIGVLLFGLLVWITNRRQ